MLFTLIIYLQFELYRLFNKYVIIEFIISYSIEQIIQSHVSQQTHQQRILSTSLLTLLNIIQSHVTSHLIKSANSKEYTNVKDAKNSSVNNAVKTNKKSSIKMVSGPNKLIEYAHYVNKISSKFIKPYEKMICNGIKTQECPNNGFKTCTSLQQSRVKANQKQKDYEYNHFLKLFYQHKQFHQEAVQIIDKDVIKGRTDSSVFNFSMREFFYTVKSDIDDKVSRDNIKNVLYALAARYDKIGYCQGMSGVAAFLLCFSSEKTAYTLFCDLLQNVYSPNFFIRNQYGISLSGLLAESYFLQEYFIHYLNVQKKSLIQKVRGQFYDQTELSHFRTIIQLVSSKALLSLFVGIVSFSNCIFIWQQIKQHRSIEVIEKAFIAIIYLNRQKILQNRSFKIIEEIFQRMNLQEFKEFYHDIEIDQKLRKQLLDEYYEGVKKKWDLKPDQQVKVLQKLTNFSAKQINLLKDLFPQQNGVCIKIEQFTKLIKSYFEILKILCPKDTILETKEYFVSKIYNIFNKDKKEGLDFREFILCMNVCTKSNVKQRIRAILGTFKDENELITFESFEKLIKNISMISDDKIFEEKKQQFEKRMRRYFSKVQRIHFNELQILLNDDFINELCLIVKSQTSEIMQKSIEKYKNLN